MFIKLNKRAQSTAEYAILFGLVVGALLAMQVYVRRGLQGRIKDVVDYKGDTEQVGAITGGTGTASSTFAWGTSQYEPYYTTSGVQSNQSSSEREVMERGGDVVRDSRQDMNATRNTTTGNWKFNDGSSGSNTTGS